MTFTMFCRMCFILLMTRIAGASLFQDVEKTFWKADVPNHQALLGYWAGRCVYAGQPNQAWPAIYVYKMLHNDDHFPPRYPSQSYYWEQNENSAFFDKMSPKNMLAYPPIQRWFAREQWTRVKEEERMFQNYFRHSDDQWTRRLVRVYDDEFSTTVLLRITRFTGSTGETTTLCYFSKYAGMADGEEANLIGNTGFVFNKTVEVKNASSPEKEYDEITFVNEGPGEIAISHIQITLASGDVSLGPEEFTLPPSKPVVLELGLAARISAVQFYVFGKTANIRVTGRRKE